MSNLAELRALLRFVAVAQQSKKGEHGRAEAAQPVPGGGIQKKKRRDATQRAVSKAKEDFSLP